MQRLHALSKHISQWSIYFSAASLTVALLIVAIIAWCGSGCAYADADTPEIIYAKSGNGEFSATLAADSDSEIIPVDEGLIKVTANGNPIPFKLETGSPGEIEISGKLPNLPDGRHRAAIETYAPDKNRLDRRQILLFVDSAPPVIELVEPRDIFPRTSSLLLFSVKDPEAGSGVVADLEESDLEVDIAGAEVFSKAYTLKNNALHLAVMLKFKDLHVPPGYRFRVKISLKDRAGNPGHYTKEFEAAALTEPGPISLCRENGTEVYSTGGFLVYPEKTGLFLPVGESRDITFYISEKYVVDHNDCVRGSNCPPREEMARQITNFFYKEIGSRIDVTSNSGSIIIEKQEDKDLADGQITYTVMLRSAMPMGDQMSSLQVSYPVEFSMDKALDLCPYYKDFTKIPKSAFSYTYETMAIPVTLETVPDPFKMKVAQEGDQLVAMVKFNPANLMDTAASWFEIDGEQYWFEMLADRGTAKGAVREGAVHYRVAATHKIAMFRDLKEGSSTGGRTLFNAGDILVRMSPPVITGFSYDRVANTLQATIADEGTPLGELAFKLELSGYDIDFDFDSSTGKLEAILPFTPLSVVAASLLVSDLAGQTTTGRCKVYGNPGGNANPAPGKTTLSKYLAATSPATGKTADGDAMKVIGSAGSGLHLLQVCKESLQSGIYINGNFVQMSPGSVKLIQLKVRASVRPYYGASGSHQWVSGGRKPGVKVFYNHYDAFWYEPDLRAGASLQITNKGSSTSPRRKIYYLKGYYEGSRFIPADDFHIGLRFTTKAVETCRVEKRDISSPAIQAFYNPESGEVTGTIHDHGMPLSELQVAFSGRNDSNNIRSYQQKLPFIFKNGRFTGRFEPPSRGEFFILELRAVDKAGNAGIFTLQVAIPRAPPQVDIQIETEKSDLIFSHKSEVINTYMTAEAKDDSEILPGGTTFVLDGQILPPFNRLNIRPYHLRSSAFWRSNFHYRGMYAAAITEGPHRARFRATDATGLSSEITKRFDFNLSPVIRGFKIMPGAILKAGGPVFTAMVIDRGGDLDLKGLALTVDGNPVEASRLYYDPASGYFAVDGPLDLPDGRHVAKLTAIDSRGNRVTDSLRFVRMFQAVSAQSSEGVSALSIDAVSLLELKGHNGDGQANPGELVRLFISLRNDSEYDGQQCRGSLFSGDENITVETENVLYGQLYPCIVIVPMKGFDLQIGRDVLAHTVSDPYDTHFDLTVTCASKREWTLPLTLPIYRPSLPTDISSVVSVQIRELPPATTSSDIQVHGNVISTGAFIEEVVVRVNGAVAGPVVYNHDGGRFETVAALEEGANVIEVAAADTAGARGFATGYIHRASAFVPPSIAIATPAEGAFFQCNNVTVTGTYDTGSSQLRSITIPNPDPRSSNMCLVTIIDDTHFSADCGVLFDGGTFNINATLETTQGVRVNAVRGIIVGDCS